MCDSKLNRGKEAAIHIEFLVTTFMMQDWKKSHCQHFWTSSGRNSYQDRGGGKSLTTRVLWTRQGILIWGLWRPWISAVAECYIFGQHPASTVQELKWLSVIMIIHIVCTATAYRSLSHSWRSHFMGRWTNKVKWQSLPQQTLWERQKWQVDTSEHREITTYFSTCHELHLQPTKGHS